MIIAYSKIESKEFGICEWLIVDDQHVNLNDEMNFCIPDSTPIAEAILKAHKQNRNTFFCNGIHYALLDFSLDPDAKIHTEEIIDTIQDRSIEIFVCANSISCQRNKHNITTARAIVDVIGKRGSEIISINKCNTCNPSFFFISYTCLQEYQKQFGAILFNMKLHSSIKEAGNTMWGRDAHELKIIGYSVAEKDGLSADARQSLLAYIIDNEIMGLTKYDIINHLSQLVDRAVHNEKWYNSMIKWQEDLWFVMSYDTQKEELYIGELYR